MEPTKRILFNKFTKADNKSEWLDYIKTVSEEWYEELKTFLYFQTSNVYEEANLKTILSKEYRQSVIEQFSPNKLTEHING